MNRYAADAAAANRSYHQRLAASLVAGLGYDAAIGECLNNGWQGVIEALLAQRARRGEVEGPGRGNTCNRPRPFGARRWQLTWQGLSSVIAAPRGGWRLMMRLNSCSVSLATVVLLASMSPSVAQAADAGSIAGQLLVATPENARSAFRPDRDLYAQS